MVKLYVAIAVEEEGGCCGQDTLEEFMSVHVTPEGAQEVLVKNFVDADMKYQQDAYDNFTRIRPPTHVWVKMENGDLVMNGTIYRYWLDDGEPNTAVYTVGIVKEVDILG
jgi:hypothetical protein